MASSAVKGLFAALGEAPDETLSAYLISTLEDSEAGLNDLAELQDIVAGFLPSFDELPTPQQQGLLVQLIKQVRQKILYLQLWETLLNFCKCVCRGDTDKRPCLPIKPKQI